MPDDNNVPTPTNPEPPVDTPVVENNSDAQAPTGASVAEPEATPSEAAPVNSEIPVEVARKIGEAHNILIALSSDPSVDEMSAAIGLSLFLDKLGKRATAIYSGATPNALEFLKPEETFEPSADTLQDFVVALNKEKADHLRYKLDGDFVKIYITPYRTKITEEDLDFSYGDFNVDLVLALDVANGIDLDAALREHGRIMHDASIVNITTGNPGKLGEIEWSDKSASSISEMIAKLLYSINSDVKIGKEEATAFLTGIVASTNRFSNAGTTPETMKVASKLMESGANQQLISKNITPDIENEMINMLNIGESAKKSDSDPAKLDIEHGHEEGVDESKEVDATVTEKESTLLDDLKQAEANLSQGSDVVVPEAKEEPVKVEEPETGSAELPDLQATMNELSSAPIEEPTTSETVLQPSEELQSEAPINDESGKYGQMLENALDSVGADTKESASEQSITPPTDNPASASAPAVPSAPEINGVPEINYMPMPGDEVLPPPPAPPISMDTTGVLDNATTPPAAPSANIEPITPAAPATEPTPEPLGAQPAMQDQVYAPQAADPGSFQIPGM